MNAISAAISNTRPSVVCYDIDWEVDSEEDLEDLPKVVLLKNVPFNPNEHELKPCRHLLDDSVELLDDVVSDTLSDTIGFLHNGFEFEEFPDFKSAKRFYKKKLKEYEV
jgi:hypothetical protein